VDTTGSTSRPRHGLRQNQVQHNLDAAKRETVDRIDGAVDVKNRPPHFPNRRSKNISDLAFIVDMQSRAMRGWTIPRRRAS
jgi:hypothetical protein